MLGRKHGYYFADNDDEAYIVDWAIETQADFWGTKTYQMWMNNETDA